MTDNLKEIKHRVTPYLYQKLKERIATIPTMQHDLIKEAIVMSEIGINSEEDHKNFFYILRHAGSFSKKLSSHKFSSEELAKFAHLMYVDRNKYPINTIFNFYKAAELALNKMRIPIKKIAYPEGDNTPDIKNPHDIQKWMSSMKQIYALGQNPGTEISQAFDTVTANWDKMEKQDFKYWMSFYEENAHNKYKTAFQADTKYYQAGPGAMIPIEHLKSKLPGAPDMRQFDHEAAAESEEVKRKAEADKKEAIKKKIRAIVSRLNAAERLATDPEVQRDLQQCLDTGIPKWLETLQGVKRQIQLAPMRSSNSTILEDLIYKQANILNSQGYPKTARELIKLAQEAPPNDPSMSMPGDMGGTPNGKDALEQLVQNMNNTDLNESEDDLNAIEDTEDDPMASITVTAQAMPKEDPAPVAQKPTLEVKEPGSEPAKTVMDPRTDDLFEAALSNVNMIDIITRLETLANIFRTREIPRQLAIIDLMMDKLNISAFFPSLAEASSKSLESNQYALTRIEDILSKLRGSVETPKGQELDLVGRGTTVPQPVPDGINPEQVRQNLAKQDEVDKARKERRQAEEDAKATQTARPAPEEVVTNVPEELAQPANIVPIPRSVR